MSRTAAMEFLKQWSQIPCVQRKYTVQGEQGICLITKSLKKTSGFEFHRLRCCEYTIRTCA